MFFELRNLTYSFSVSKKILDNISLELEKGKIYALMGANGSGKTTLFNIITGFITPQSGDIFFNLNRINKLLPHKINRLGIGRTFQDLRLISKLTVKENVLLAMDGNPTQSWYKAMLPKPVYKTEINVLEEKAEEIIRTCFLQDVEYSLAGEISYGQQKLLNLACCIANDAELLLLDEPVAGISSSYKEQIVILIKNLKEKDKTILMIEHNTDFTSKTADHFLLLTDGSVFEYNNFVELKKSKIAADVYF